MVRLKKVFSLLLTLCMITALLPVMSVSTGASTAHSQAEAVEWAKARANEAWCLDVDGCYGCQCVDLILAYYDYLGVSRSHGNACDYAGNALPVGWIRVYSDPQPGDIIVWGPGAMMTPPYITSDPNYGHVGIITGIVSATQVSTVETRSAYDYDPARAVEYRNSNTAACFIRPDFGTTLSASWEGPTVENITETNAFPKAKISFGVRAYTNKCGIIVTDENGVDVARSDENVDYPYTYVTFYYDINNELNCILESGKTYNVCFYTVTNGQEFWSPTVSFTTPHTHNYTNTVVIDPTCSKKGCMRHICSCGDSYDDNYTDMIDHEYKITSETPNGIVLTCVNCGQVYTVDKTSELTSEVSTEKTSEGKELFLRKTNPDSSTMNSAGKVNETSAETTVESTTAKSVESTTVKSDEITTVKPTEAATEKSTEVTTAKPNGAITESETNGLEKLEFAEKAEVEGKIDEENKKVSILPKESKGITLDDFKVMFKGAVSVAGEKIDKVFNGMKFMFNGNEYTFIIKGDTQADGKIAASDARMILRFAAKLDNPDDVAKESADINSDGNITSMEARSVLRFAAKLQNKLYE